MLGEVSEKADLRNQMLGAGGAATSSQSEEVLIIGLGIPRSLILKPTPKF